MLVGVMLVEFEIPMANSLKEKRSVLNKMKDRVRNKFNVSIAEVDDQDVWNYTKIGISVVSNQQKFANQVLDKVFDLLESFHDAEIVDHEIDFLRYD
tara:strand:+ start:138 stop:428 length:291 start_codon:yes stop_codon:yes gene_type:complete